VVWAGATDEDRNIARIAVPSAAADLAVAVNFSNVDSEDVIEFLQVVLEVDPGPVDLWNGPNGEKSACGLDSFERLNVSDPSATISAELLGRHHKRKKDNLQSAVGSKSLWVNCTTTTTG
jgi:hypothetical protein